jgi:glycosyltransferase involved in cell wall biosynthesis
MSESAVLRHTRLFGERLTARWRRDGWIPDLVHAHYWLGGLVAMVASRQARVPIALTFHEIGSIRQRHLGADDASPSCRIGLERELGRTVGRVITQSRAEMSALARQGVPRRQMVLIPIGVNPDSFAPDSPLAPRGPGRRRIVAVGSAGRLSERKGFIDLVRALRHVPDAEMVVIGGPDQAGLARDAEVRKVRAAARSCGVADRIQFVGQVPREEMPRWYRSADLVACAPWYEPFGVTALEAMAAGVPVVATAVGGLRDTVVDGVTGVLVPPRQPVALGRAMRSVLANPIRRMEYAAAGLDRARQCYAWDRVASRLGAQYQSLTADQPG